MSKIEYLNLLEKCFKAGYITRESYETEKESVKCQEV
jgi:hypothetical protein